MMKVCGGKDGMTFGTSVDADALGKQGKVRRKRIGIGRGVGMIGIDGGVGLVQEGNTVGVGMVTTGNGLFTITVTVAVM